MISFCKYQGTGNDFIIIDNRSLVFKKENTSLISRLCDRRFGIGADGLMLLQEKPGYDFEMVYFNSDGKTSSMCGNGGRCIAAFAKDLGIVKAYASFLAIDGPHEVKFKADLVSLKMNDVSYIEVHENDCFLDTGSPHYVTFVSNAEAVNVVEEGKKIRFSERFRVKGTNVNFVENMDGKIAVRTYERGVEDETFSCGTGVTAAAICASIKGLVSEKDFCDIQTRGGMLKVYFKRKEDLSYTDIWLEGPAKFVFRGEINE